MPGCVRDPGLQREQFVDASVAYLRQAFAVTAGFEGGIISYGESYVPLTDATCPAADWTALSYTVAIDPSRVPLELRATHDRVVAVWTLSGRKFVALLPPTQPTNDRDQWQYGRLPDNVNAVARADADPEELDALVNRITAEQPAMTVTWLSAIGVLTIVTPIGTFESDAIGTGNVPQIEQVAAELRASGLFTDLDWSGLNLRIPNESWPGTTLDESRLAPECLRAHTKELRDTNQLTTMPSLAEPLGPGPITTTPVCQ